LLILVEGMVVVKYEQFATHIYIIMKFYHLFMFEIDFWCII